MKVLVSKLGALGDLVHCLPAITDAASLIDDLSLDWIVEEPFMEIPSWHPNVNRVIVWPSRRWRNGTWHYRQEITRTIRAIRRQKYDAVIDAQGILKATLPAFIARGPLSGFTYELTRDRLAALFYRTRYRHIVADTHASDMIRGLFAHVLGYDLPNTPADPNISNQLRTNNSSIRTDDKTLVLLHGTTWQSKHLPEQFWLDVIDIMHAIGWQIVVPWHGGAELQRAERFAAHSPNVSILPPLSLTQLGGILLNAGAVIGPDTGLAHVAAAAGTPTMVMFGPSSAPVYHPIGARADTYIASKCCAPCMQKTCAKLEGQTAPPCWKTVDPSTAIERLLKL